MAFFARVLIGEELWPHQLEVALSRARHRVLCSGRQAGKSRTVSVIALHRAFSSPGVQVLVLSAGEDAARELLGQMATLASSPILAGSVVDENQSTLRLTNGSVIRSVPASQRQVRGRAVDLLIIDEAAFVEDELWNAAKFTTLAREGSQVLLASTPWGSADRFFAVAFRAGQRGVDGYESFHWPSTASPMVDETLLEEWRATEPEHVFRREVLAEWVDDYGAYFETAELEASVGEYEMTPPHQAGGRGGVGGVDWGFARDANALAVLAWATPEDFDLAEGERVLFVPWIEAESKIPYARWVERVAVAAEGYRLGRVMSEINGVGAMPTQELISRLSGAGCRVEGVSTTAALKEQAFGALKVLMQQGRLVLPRHPELLSQLSSLRFEQRDSGTMHISVPERLGHDDLAMALALASMGEPSLTAKPRRRRSIVVPSEPSAVGLEGMAGFLSS